MDYTGYAQRSLVTQSPSLADQPPMFGAVAGTGQPRLSEILRQMADVLELQEAGDIAKENALQVLQASVPGPLGAALASMLDASTGESDSEEGDDGDEDE